MLLIKNSILANINTKSNLSLKFQSTEWFQNPIYSGGFIFFMNAIYFSIALLLIFLSNKAGLHFLYFLIVFAVLFLSIWFWCLINVSWKGRIGERIMMASIGSSFYLLVGLFFLYKFMNLKSPHTSNGFGLLLGTIVSVIAFITCFLFTALEKKVKKV
jgi:hypothetical protein